MTRSLLAAIAMLGLMGCAGLQQREPIDVIVVGVEPQEGQGMELRMLVKLRIQNPNDSPIDFDGVSLKMDVQGKRFATGVSDASGSVPRFGEAIVSVPVSISMFRIARQAMGVMADKSLEKLEYEMTGRLSGPAFNSVRFSSKGEFNLPADAAAGQ
jgi:LEA14-like dessication related protein